MSKEHICTSLILFYAVTADNGVRFTILLNNEIEKFIRLKTKTAYFNFHVGITARLLLVKTPAISFQRKITLIQNKASSKKSGYKNHYINNYTT